MGTRKMMIAIFAHFQKSKGSRRAFLVLENALSTASSPYHLIILLAFTARSISARSSLKTLLEDSIGLINLSCVGSYQCAPARTSFLIRCMFSSTSMAALGIPAMDSRSRYTIPRVPIVVINTPPHNLRRPSSSMYAFAAAALIASS